MNIVAENQNFSGSGSSSSGKNIVKIGALIAVLVGTVAIALIFMSKIINNTPETKKYETKTTTTPTTVTPSTTTSPATYDDYPWELNQVTFEQLTSIDEIGEDIAEKIIAFRTLNEKFTSMSQLMEIDGIGEKRYNILCEYLYLDGEVVTSKIEEITTTTAVTTKVSTKKTTTTPTPVATTTKRERKLTNLNTATLEEFMENLFLTYEEADSIVRLRNDIQYFQNPLEVLYATDEKGKTMFTDSEYNEFKDYLTV